MKWNKEITFLIIGALLGAVVGYLIGFFSSGESTAFMHITKAEIVGLLFGVILVWVLRYSKEKDLADDNHESFSLSEWLYDWFTKKNDNILAHVFFSFSALYIGVNNLQAWLGDQINFPDGVDEVGASFIIGFFGSYACEILKKAL